MRGLCVRVDRSAEYLLPVMHSLSGHNDMDVLHKNIFRKCLDECTILTAFLFLERMCLAVVMPNATLTN